MPLPIATAPPVLHKQQTSSRMQRKLQIQVAANSDWKKPISSQILTERLLSRFYRQWAARHLYQYLYHHLSRHLYCYTPMLEKQEKTLAGLLTYPGPEYIDSQLLDPYDQLDLIDISTVLQQRLKTSQSPSLLQKKKVRYLTECLPYTRLQDNSYDLLIAVDHLASLPATLQQLQAVEYARLLKKKGLLWFTTPLDPKTLQPAERCLSLLSKYLEPVSVFQLSERIPTSIKSLQIASRLSFSKRIKKDEKLHSSSKLDLYHNQDLSEQIFAKSLFTQLLPYLYQEQVCEATARTQNPTKGTVYFSKTVDLETLFHQRRPHYLAALFKKRILA